VRAVVVGALVIVIINVVIVMVMRTVGVGAFVVMVRVRAMVARHIRHEGGLIVGGSFERKVMKRKPLSTYAEYLTSASKRVTGLADAWLRLVVRHHGPLY